MNRMRLRIAERLKESQNTAASLTTFNEVDMSALLAMRNKYKDAVLEKHGVKLGFMSPFVRAAVAALKDIPAVNARIEGDSIVYQDFVDVSVAVATPKGLVTPVLRNCETQSMVEIEKSLAGLSKKVLFHCYLQEASRLTLWHVRPEMETCQLKTWPVAHLRFLMVESLGLCMGLQSSISLSLLSLACTLQKSVQWL